MRKLFAIGTLLLSSAAVMVSPAAASDRNYVNNQNHNQVYSAPAPVKTQVYNRGYVAPAPVVAQFNNRVNDRAGFDRDAQIRLEQRARAERLERERLERSRHNVRYVRSLRDGC